MEFPAEWDQVLNVAQDVPKTELHLHLDGSLRPSFLCRRANARGTTTFDFGGEEGVHRVPDTTDEMVEFVQDLKRATFNRKPPAGKDWSHVAAAKNWPVFDFMNLFLQTAEELEAATFELCEDLREDNVVHAEIRFCPTLHTTEGLSVSGAVEAVVSGFTRSGIQGGIIICALRTHPKEHSMDMAKLTEQWHGRGVVGFDIAGAETYDLSIHVEALRYLATTAVPITVHAGEIATGTLHNIKLALEVPVHRIGHGFAMAFGEGLEEPEVMQDVARSGIVVECCMTSNLGKIPTYAVHPIAAMHRAGVKVSLSSDNALLSSKPNRGLWAKASYELAHLVAHCGLSWTEAREVLLNGARGAFIADIEAHAKWLKQYSADLNSALQRHDVMELDHPKT